MTPTHPTPITPSTHNPQVTPDEDGLALRHALRWGVFLGISWTWVIGMWLPVVLISDFGSSAFLIFAIPNCLGAAAMGYVLRTPEDSARFVSRHRAACKLFSQVTLAFQFYVLASMMPWIDSSNNASAPEDITRSLCVIAPFMLALVAGAKRFRRSVASTSLAFIIFIVSLVCGACFIATETIVSVPFVDPSRPSSHYVGLALVCMFGFILCPYLDLTFHRARQALTTRSQSRAGFTFGFCVIFASMIAITSAYAAIDWNTFTPIHPGYLPAILYIHIGLQVAFKVLAHGGYLTGSVSAATDTQSRFSLGSISAVVIIGICFAILQTFFSRVASSYLYVEMNHFEIIYRAFLGMYGLVFPTYIWLCSCPVGPWNTGPTRRNLRVCGATIALALPFFTLGFIGKSYDSIMIGCVIILIAKFITQRSLRLTA